MILYASELRGDTLIPLDVTAGM